MLTHLIYECRKLLEAEDLTDDELAMMHVLKMYKPAYRARELQDLGMRYSTDCPVMQSLIHKGFVAVQGRNITPDRKKIKVELAKHQVPERYRNSLENASLSFRIGDRPPIA